MEMHMLDDHEELLKPMRARIDGAMMATAALLFLVTIAVGLVFDQLVLSLAIGIPTLIVSTVIWRLMRGTLISRLTMASTLITLIAIQIQASHGMIEMHFGLFAVLAFLLAYRDWRPIIFGALLIAVQHVVCNFLQAGQFDVWIFHHGEDFGIVLLHAAYVVFESVILIYLALQLRTEGIEAAKVAFLAERITQGDLSSNVARGKETGSEGMLTSMIAMQDSLSRLVTEIEVIVDAAVQGDFSKKIDLSNKSGFGNKICGLLNQLSQTTEVGLNDVMRVTNALAAGDLTQKITEDYPGVFGKTKNGVNNTVDSLTRIVGEIHQIVDAAASNKNGCNLKMDIENKQGFSRSLAESFNQLSISIDNNLNDILHVANGMTPVTDKGVEVVGQVMTTMDSIKQSSNKISEITVIIDEITFQTNILALNAAVEAARAGSEGRGFAVVAGEVRTLSQRVAAAASEIKQLVNDSEIKIATGNKLVNDAGETMHEIASSIRSVIGIVSEFSSASSSIQHDFRSKVDDAVVDLVQTKQRRLA